MLSCHAWCPNHALSDCRHLIVTGALTSRGRSRAGGAEASKRVGGILCISIRCRRRTALPWAAEGEPAKEVTRCSSTSRRWRPCGRLGIEEAARLRCMRMAPGRRPHSKTIKHAAALRAASWRSWCRAHEIACT